MDPQAGLSLFIHSFIQTWENSEYSNCNELIESHMYRLDATLRLN